MNKYLFIIVVASLALLTQANAEYYEYTDEYGNIAITNDAGSIPENQRSTIKILKEQSASSGNPAPYTAEAAKKIEAAANQQRGHNTMIINKKIKENASSEERQKYTIEAMRSIYEAAGYSFDDTIIQVAKDVQDIQHKPDLINVLKDKNSILVQTIMGVSMMMSECNYKKVDCLKFFSTETAAAIMMIVGSGNNGMLGATQPNYHPPTTVKAEKSNIQKNRPMKMNPSKVDCSRLPPPDMPAPGIDQSMLRSLYKGCGIDIK